MLTDVASALTSAVSLTTAKPPKPKPYCPIFVFWGKSMFWLELFPSTQPEQMMCPIMICPYFVHHFVAHYVPHFVPHFVFHFVPHSVLHFVPHFVPHSVPHFVPHFVWHAVAPNRRWPVFSSLCVAFLRHWLWFLPGFVAHFENGAQNGARKLQKWGSGLGHGMGLRMLSPMPLPMLSPMPRNRLFGP